MPNTREVSQMSKENRPHSLFRYKILPFIFKMIEKIIDKLLDGLTFRKGDDRNYISYNAG